MFNASNDMSLKGMVEGSLLFKDEPRTPNIESYGGLNLRKRVQGTVDFSILVFIFC